MRWSSRTCRKRTSTVVSSPVMSTSSDVTLVAGGRDVDAMAPGLDFVRLERRRAGVAAVDEHLRPVDVAGHAQAPSAGGGAAAGSGSGSSSGSGSVSGSGLRRKRLRPARVPARPVAAGAGREGEGASTAARRSASSDGRQEPGHVQVVAAAGQGEQDKGVQPSPARRAGRWFGFVQQRHPIMLLDQGEVCRWTSARLCRDEREVCR